MATAVLRRTRRTRRTRRAYREERGATAVEYGIMAMLIAAVVIAAVFALGQATNADFECTGSSIRTTTEAC